MLFHLFHFMCIRESIWFKFGQGIIIKVDFCQQKIDDHEAKWEFKIPVTHRKGDAYCKGNVGG